MESKRVELWYARVHIVDDTLPTTVIYVAARVGATPLYMQDILECCQDDSSHPQTRTDTNIGSVVERSVTPFAAHGLTGGEA